MKKALTILFLVAISFATKISAQTNTENKSDVDKNSVDLPQYIDTGNPDIDKANYNDALKRWNEEQYQKALIKYNTIVITPVAQPNVSTTLPDNFPKFINTGNPDLDNENYRIAKEKWISENSDKYEKLNPTLK